MLQLFQWTGTLGLFLILSSCGLKGDLYLPEKNNPVVIITSPTQTSSSSSTNSSQP
jgi:hypothetical protein